MKTHYPLGTKFYSWYCGEKISETHFDCLKDAQNWISVHPNYKKSYFTKKGEASSKNPNEKEYFHITDNMGNMWSIRNI